MKRAGRVVVRMVVLAIILTISTSQSLAQPRRGGGFRGGQGGPGGFLGGGGLMNLIQQQEVQKEIELSTGQQAELQTLSTTIRDEVRNEMQDMFQGVRDLSRDERQAKFEEIRTRIAEINKDVETRMQNVLMPHQLERLKQIELQSRIQRGGAAALTEGELADTLGITDSQRDQLREKAEEVQKDLNEKISQLRVEARNQLLEVLTPEQRAKLASMMGADFSLPQRQFGAPGQAGRRGLGARGGRGGRRRGQQNNAPAGGNSGN